MTEAISRVVRYLQDKNYTAFLFTVSDPHGSEYPGSCDKWIRYLCGFTGSAGTLTVFADGSACFWADGRYHIQAEQQLEGSGVSLFKEGLDGVLTPAAFLSDRLKEGDVLVLPEDYTSAGAFRSLQKALPGITVTGAALEGVLSETFWPDRPRRTATDAWILPEEMSGQRPQSRIEFTRRLMNTNGIDHVVISTLETIAWAFNLRGNDISCTPVLYAYLILGQKDGSLYLQNDSTAALPAGFINGLEAGGITVRDYRLFYDDLKTIGGTVGFDPSAVNRRIERICSQYAQSVTEIANDRLMPKSVKNPIEIRNMHKAHLKDGIALTRLIYDLKMTRESLNEKRMTEWDVAMLLEEKKRVFDDYIEPSFSSISAYGENAAICHYAPDEDHHAYLEPRGFLLLDCGGQYLCGTTDVTRTIALGPLSDDEKEYYTAVLKGHLRLMNAVIDPQTPTRRLDELARGPIKELGGDYLHGTGHGVGFVLSVHEGPARIVNSNNKDMDDHPLVRGNVVSDEPGYYRENEFGIRIENLIAVARTAGRRLYFEPLTLVPYEPEAILAERLSDEEKRWLNRYHRHVYEKLSPHLSGPERIWLEEVTSPLL